jgi:hypothetical protein
VSQLTDTFQTETKKGYEMKELSTMWDRPVTDAELERFYGKDQKHEVRDLIIETITETVRNVDSKALSVPYVSYAQREYGKVCAYPLVEVITDYGTEPKCVDALMAVIEKSDCPLVAAWRMAIAERFADSHADEVEELQGE